VLGPPSSAKENWQLDLSEVSCYKHVISAF